MDRLVVFTVAVFLAGVPVHAAEKADAGPRQTADAFLTRAGRGEIASAFDDLFLGSPTAATKGQGIDVLKRQYEAGRGLYGNPLGFELENEKKLGQSLVRLTYIQKFDQHPLIWRFWFYRPVDKWFVDSVLFNDQVQTLDEK